MGILGKTLGATGKILLKTAELTGKAAIKIVELSLDAAADQAEKASKNRNYSEEKRERAKEQTERYAEAHESFSGFAARFERKDEPSPTQTGSASDHTHPNSSEADTPQSLLHEWENKWVACGKLISRDIDVIPPHTSGILRLCLHEQTVYIAASNTLGGSDLLTRIHELYNPTRCKVANLIKAEENNLNLDVLIIGSDLQAFKTCRMLEAALIDSVKPLWLS